MLVDGLSWQSGWRAPRGVPTKVHRWSARLRRDDQRPSESFHACSLAHSGHRKPCGQRSQSR